MRDHNGRAIDHQGVQRGTNVTFAEGVEMRSRFIEDENRRIFQEGPRDRDALALTAGELDTALSDASLKALWQS